MKVKMNQKEEFVIGVRFKDIGKVYHFEPGSFTDIKVGDAVIVETSRGWQIGKVASVIKKSKLSSKGGWKQIDRRATPRDLMVRHLWERKEAEVLDYCQQLSEKLNLKGTKFVSAEYSFDGTRLSITLNKESKENGTK